MLYKEESKQRAKYDVNATVLYILPRKLAVLYLQYTYCFSIRHLHLITMFKNTVLADSPVFCALISNLYVFDTIFFVIFSPNQNSTGCQHWKFLKT